MKVLLTGATSGIGKKLKELLEARGEEVIAFGSREGDFRKTLTPLFQAIESQMPEVIINCAGVGLYGEGVDLPFAEQKELVQINALAPMELTLFAASLYKSKGLPLIILHVSSLAGECPTPNMSAYGASKAFLSNLSRALDYELEPFGIRILVSAPGMVDTPFMERAAKKKIPRKGYAMRAEKAARLILWQIERKKPFSVIDGYYQILFWFFPFLPVRVIMKRIYQSIARRR